MKEKPKYLFLSSMLNYPFHGKRMLAVHELEVPVEAIGFDRELNYPSLAYPFACCSLGTNRHGRYFSRLMDLLRGIPKVRAAMDKADVAHCFGLDALLLCFISLLFKSRKPAIVYEVQDIRGILTRRGLVSSILRGVDRRLAGRSDHLVVTSPSYVRNYFEGLLKMVDPPFQVIENKLHPEEVPARIQQSPPPDGRIRIGYFGSIRCPVAWAALVSLVEEAEGRVQLYVRGAPKDIESFHTDVERCPEIIYGGPYKDPEDLGEIYSQVDLVWTAGFDGKDSYLWSRHCRYYNACCFKVPLVSQVGTDEAEVVESLGIGTSVDIRDASSVRRLLDLPHSLIREWRENMIALPAEHYTYTDEHAELVKRLVEVLGGR